MCSAWCKCIDVEKLPHGLRLTLTEQGRTEIADLRERYPDWYDAMLFAELFQYQLCNGWGGFRPEEIGALTGCEIIISDDSDRDDHGDVCRLGDVYWHERYAVENAIEKLETTGLFLLKA